MKKHAPTIHDRSQRQLTLDAIGEVTAGAENDLLQATRLARRMVTSWGMSELGLAAYDSSSEDRFLGYEPGQGRA